MKYLMLGLMLLLMIGMAFTAQAACTNCRQGGAYIALKLGENTSEQKLELNPITIILIGSLIYGIYLGRK